MLRWGVGIVGGGDGGGGGGVSGVGIGAGVVGSTRKRSLVSACLSQQGKIIKESRQKDENKKSKGKAKAKE